MSCTTTFTFTAGQISAEPLAFTQRSGAALNLTGATVYLMAKTSYGDLDDDAVLDLSQATHSDAVAGETTLDIDLSGLADIWFSNGGKLTASIWIVDAQAQRIPYGNLTIEILPSAKRWPA